MTGAQKKQIAYFLDVTADYLRDGYARTREYRFADDPAAPTAAETQPPREAGARAGPETPPPRETPARAGPETPDSLEKIAEEIRTCTRCPLHTPQTQPLPGDGVKRPLVVVVAGAPLGEENALGRAFAGTAGAFFDTMLQSVNLSRSRNCFLTYAVKCCPPKNRHPLAEELAACAEFLSRQIARLKPAHILSVGQGAAQLLLHTNDEIAALNGVFASYAGIPLLPIYHPAAVLRDEGLKRPVWEALKALQKKLIPLDERYALEIREGG